MQSGKAPIVESSTLPAMMTRKWSHRRPLSAGVVSTLTVACWTVWVYLVLPLVSLVLWALGLRLFVTQIARGAYEGLHRSLVSYSFVMAVIVGLLAYWIVWNVLRYGGRHDRRTVKRAEVTDLEIQKAFVLDDGLLASLRSERLLRVDLDGDGGVRLLAAHAPRTPPVPGAEGPSVSQRATPDPRPGNRDRTRSG
jgi:poly-beta-1,6-N-acetyl-D-glucosamine biosynthesis protein PgaD